MSNSANITREQLRVVLLATELGGKAGDAGHFSYAQLANSSSSFGEMQFDVGANPAARDFLADNGFDAADIAALIVKLTSDGALVFDKQFDGRNTETGDGVAIAPDNTIYVAGTTTSFGAGSQDAFVLHLQPTGKKLLDALTWGGPGFETGAGVAVGGPTLMLAATTTMAPPYSLLAASAKLSTPRGTLAVVEGVLTDVPGVAVALAAGAAIPDGSTTFSGNFEAALVRIAR